MSLEVAVPADEAVVSDISVSNVEVSVQRIVSASQSVMSIPGSIEVVVSTSVVVAERVVPETGADEQMQNQMIPTVDQDDRSKAATQPVAMKSNRSVGDSTVAEEVIPVTGDINVTAGSENVTRRDPNPVGLVRSPVTGTPTVIVIHIHPRSGNVKVIVSRRRAARTELLSRGRFRQIGDFLGRFLSPVSVNPLPAPFDFMPVARNPGPARRDVTPHPAGPDEVVEFFVEREVSRDPDDVFTFGLQIRRNFVNRLGRLAIDD